MDLRPFFSVSQVTHFELKLGTGTFFLKKGLKKREFFFFKIYSARRRWDWTFEILTRFLSLLSQKLQRF